MVTGSPASQSRRAGKRAGARRQLVGGNQHVDRAFVQVDTDAVARFYQRQTAAVRGLGRGVQDRGRSRCARLASVPDTGKLVDALLDEIGRRPHVDDLGAAGIADRAGPAHHEDGRAVHAEGLVIDPLMEIDRPVEDIGRALECVRVVRVRQEPFAEGRADHACLHDGAVEQVAAEIDEAGFRFIGLSTDQMTSPLAIATSRQLSPMLLPLAVMA